ncbi:MAG: glycosyltransferase family 2 protein [Alphaproteobacteria bacterium]
MRVSAVILSFNSAGYLESCLNALIAALGDHDDADEIVVVENGSSDSSADILRRFEADHPGLVHGIYNDENLGTTVSRNQALRRATGRYVLILDSDATVAPDMLEPLMARLDADSTIGLVAPKLTYPDGRLQMSTDVFPTLTRKVQRFFALKAMENAADAAPVEAVEVDYAISAFWLLPRAAVDRVGLFDEAIFYSPEDVDYCLRIWAAGFRIVYDPTVSAVHDAQELSRGAKLSSFALRHIGGLFYLFRKHRYMFSRRGLYRRFGRR